LHGLEEPGFFVVGAFGLHAVEDDERVGAEVDDLAGEEFEFVGGIGAGAVGGDVDVVAFVFEGEDVADVVERAALLPCLGVGDGAVVVGPVVVLAAVVGGDGACTDARPGLGGIVDEDGVVGDGAEVVVDVMLAAECVVMAAVAGEFVVLVDQEVADSSYKPSSPHNAKSNSSPATTSTK